MSFIYNRQITVNGYYEGTCIFDAKRWVPPGVGLAECRRTA
ncbi:hypothetical protein SJ05684_c33850 [Sinorhizobium sojae CCBAU 05684]|uniref:Uncharacterized protein n=1 Tax=Sinorhizobium sojae CCBAU 05684 TaxID=716928 RepID=A0A249PGG5_9HYPH|nr:hypothetical protein SJ05684_c33850 [Sinorhizobium sojae CCBAU 05684]